MRGGEGTEARCRLEQRARPFAIGSEGVENFESLLSLNVWYGVSLVVVGRCGVGFAWGGKLS